MQDHTARTGAARLLLLAALLAAPWLDPARAAVCDGVTDCEPQVQAPVPWGGWETQGWAYYCTGDHPYFWGIWWYDNTRGNATTWTWGSATGQQTCFTPGELGGPEEGHPSKLDVFATNWCNSDALNVTLACSKAVPPGGSINGCIPASDPTFGDPGCRNTYTKSYCNNSVIPVCFVVSTEMCDDGKEYTCTAFDGLVWCQQCAP